MYELLISICISSSFYHCYCSLWWLFPLGVIFVCYMRYDVGTYMHDIKNTFTYQNEIKVSVWIFRDKIIAIYRSLANRILSGYFENDIASRIRNEDNKLIPIRKDWTHAYRFTLTTLPIYDMWVNDSVPTTIFIPKYVYISTYIWRYRCSVILFQ